MRSTDSSFLLRRQIILLVSTGLLAAATPLAAQSRPTPRATLESADELTLPGSVDSNSPAVWSIDGSQLTIFTSVDGWVEGSSGPSLTEIGEPNLVGWFTGPLGGTWMEAVVRDDQDVLYGYYHNEVPSLDCPQDGKVRPKIGAARSTDEGATWEDLGVILESNQPSKCDTTNQYDDGGIGDFSVMLDPDQRYLYVFYSAYGPNLAGQGVAAARMEWAARDEPVGALTVWQAGLWLPPTDATDSDEWPDAPSPWIYPTGTPIYQALKSWHSDDGVTDAFWGPSVHWNTYLQQYVMLLNHADSVNFNQEGIYVAFAATLDDPSGWSAPQRIVSGGTWYPQVMGLDPGSGSDKQAGQEARLFVSGRSTAVIRFDQPAPRSFLPRNKVAGR